MQKWIAIGTAAVVFAIGAVLLIQRPATTAGADAGESADGPREQVAGVHGIQQPRATLEQEQIDPAALNAAAEYAGARNSTALVVSRHGHIVFERYWAGTERDTVVDAGGFARTVAAMLVGIALEDRHITSVNEPVGSFVASFAGGDRASMTLHDLLQQDDAQPLVVLVEALSKKRYAAFLSRELWKPLAAGDASVVLDAPNGAARANCCFFARQADWLRLGQLLIDDGDYQGARILPKGWARQMVAASSRNPAQGSQLWLGTPRDGFYLAGAGKSRLWLHPGLHLAVLRMGTEPKDWDESRIPSLVIAGVIDRPQAQASEKTDLSKLVPNH